MIPVLKGEAIVSCELTVAQSSVVVYRLMLWQVPINISVFETIPSAHGVPPIDTSLSYLKTEPESRVNRTRLCRL